MGTKLERISQLSLIAEVLASVARRHWHIENGLHWVFDIVFKEDKLRSKE